MNFLSVSFLPVTVTFSGVDHHNEIACIQVGRENRLVLAAQNVRNLSGQPAKDRAIGIDHVHLRCCKSTFGKYVLISFPIRGG